MGVVIVRNGMWLGGQEICRNLERAKMLNLDFKEFLHKMLPTIQVCRWSKKHLFFEVEWQDEMREAETISTLSINFLKPIFWETAILCNSFGNSYIATLTWDFQMRDETSWCLYFPCFRTMATGSLGLNTVWMKRSGSTWWGREKYHGSDTPIWCI